MIISSIMPEAQYRYQLRELGAVRSLDFVSVLFHKACGSADEIDAGNGAAAAAYGNRQGKFWVLLQGDNLDIGVAYQQAGHSAHH